ncbi:MAG: alpha-hydroxy-acid oxidizing protein [Deltaproteobacteria bacterium]|nr:alpha-hydroxy-acid oxidizing protein [Deltaproteobacteria bacterium]
MARTRENARGKTRGFCRACPVCDGRACAGEIPGMGGAGTGASFTRNLAALAALRFRVRLVHEVRAPETSLEVMGFRLSMPLMVAPVGGLSFNLGGPMEEGAYQRAVAEGARAAGITVGTPDAAAPGIFETGLAEAGAPLGGGMLPFVKPWETGLVRERLGKAREAGCAAAAMDLDSVGLVTLRLMQRPCLPKGPRELAGIAAAARELGLRFVLKGLLTPEDALLAVEAGCDGIVVSNHGGRVLDSSPATAEALPAIAAAIKGKAAIFVDGGIRSGGDVLKMLALGADCVMVGRPFTVAAVGGGAEAVAELAEEFRGGLETAMVMTGTASVRSVPPDILLG